MGEAVIPNDLGTLIKKLEARIDVLERTSRLITSSVKDGTLVFLDQFGNEIVALGRIGTSHGIGVFDSAGKSLFYVTSEEGQLAPYSFAVPLPNGNNGLLSTQGGAFRLGTTSATMVEMYRADFFSVASTMEYDFNFLPGSAQSMSWQLTCYEYGGTPQIVASGTEIVNVQRQSSFTLPTAGFITGSGTTPGGRLMTVRVSAQRNSGTTTVDVMANGPLTNV
jgi:hypothetical protein